MQRIFCLATLILFGLAGCSLYSERQVRGALVDAGLSPPMAQCMAERLVDRLSTEELRSLKRLGKLGKGESGKLTSRAFLDRYRGQIDPKVYAALVRAGIGCAIAI